MQKRHLYPIHMLFNKYYDCFLRSTNRGFMTLMNENYFEFGFKLMKKVALALTKFKLESDIDAAEKGKKEIMNDADLWDEFLQISLKHNNQFLKEEKSIKCLYLELIEKTVNARFSDRM